MDFCPARVSCSRRPVMLVVSRLKKGQSFPQGGPVVPEELDLAAIENVLSERLKGKEDLEITSSRIDGRKVVVARYSQGKRRALEIAFPLEEHLVHVLVLANEGRYHERAEKVAFNVVRTIKAKQQTEQSDSERLQPSQ